MSAAGSNQAVPAKLLGPSLGVLSAVLLAGELTLTRLLSVVLWYHFAFFAISVALFGLSLAALLVHFFGGKIPERSVGHWLAGGALGTAAGLILVDLAFCNVAPDWFSGGVGIFTELTAKLLGLFVLSSLPFFAGGFSVSLALTRYARFASRLYFWDLLGAAAGALLTIALLSAFGAPQSLVLLSAIAALSALGFAFQARGVRAAAGLMSAACVAFAFLGGSTFNIQFAKGISLNESKPEFMQWNAFSLVSVLPYTGFKGWGLAPRYQGEIAEQKTLVIDMNAMTPLVRFDGDLSRVGFVNHDLSAFIYRIWPAAESACVIGAGGGKDVLAALASGTGAVHAVEVNPLIVNQVMRGAFREYVGDLYNHPQVHAVAEDGRSYVRRVERKFDIVHLSMVDTSAASAAGAYALTENTLYTREAFQDFFHALKPGGVLSVSGVSLPDLWMGARLVSIARAALLEGRPAGAPEPDISKHILIAETPWLGVNQARMYTLMVSPDGFSEAMVNRAIQEANQLGFSLAWAPGHQTAADNVERGLIRRIALSTDSKQLSAELKQLPLDVSPTTDDRPFVFYQNRISHLPAALFASTPMHLFGNGLVLLAKVMLAALLSVATLLFLPWIFRRRGREQGSADRGPLAFDLGYAACLGLGFLLVELGLLHRLSPHLGDPTLALGVVLVSLLLGSALGSRYFSTASAKSVRNILVGIVFASCALLLILPALAELTRSSSPALRSVSAGVLVFALGLLLGVPMPAALSRISQRAPGRVAWFWALNGGTSVLSAILSTLLALTFGTSVTILVGAAIYAVCALLAKRVLEASPEEPALSAPKQELLGSPETALKTEGAPEAS